MRRINCLEVSPTWGDGGSWRVNHLYRREIIYDFHKGESVWFLSHFRIKFFFCKPCAPCASLWWQWVTNNGNNAHLYTVFTVKLLSGECSQEEVHKLTLNLCQHAVQTNHLAKRLWRTNQHKLSGRRYLDLKDWTHRVRSGDCGNRLARCIDLPGKASQRVTHSKTNTQRQLHMIKPKHTDRNTHTRQRELIYRMHTFHSQLYARSNINKQTRCNAKHIL